MAVEVRESEEDLDLAERLRSRLFVNSPDSFLVYIDTLRIYYEPEEVDPFLKELVLLRVSK